MSWAEVKKINSDLSTPLNLAALINHIDLVGSNYVGYGDADTSVELCKTNGILVHSIASQVVLRESLSTQEKMDSYGYKCLCAIENIDYSTFADFADMMASETAMTAIITSETAMTAVAASETAMTAIAASETAMNVIIASETAMNVIIASETAMNVIIASETAISKIITNDQWLYSIAVNNDTGLGLSKLASGIEGVATTAWENDTKWDTIKTTLDASSLFTKSGLLTDTGGTHNRTGNLITLIESAYSFGNSGYKLSVTPRYTGCYEHAYNHNLSTGKHIMWGGHSSTHATAESGTCYVKHYMYTPII